MKNSLINTLIACASFFGATMAQEVEEGIALEILELENNELEILWNKEPEPEINVKEPKNEINVKKKKKPIAPTAIFVD